MNDYMDRLLPGFSKRSRHCWAPDRAAGLRLQALRFDGAGRGRRQARGHTRGRQGEGQLRDHEVINAIMQRL